MIAEVEICTPSKQCCVGEQHWSNEQCRGATPHCCPVTHTHSFTNNNDANININNNNRHISMQTQCRNFRGGATDYHPFHDVRHIWGCGYGKTSTQQMMVVPRHRLSTVGRQAFTVQGPMVWNSLPDDLHAQQDYEPLDSLKPGFSLATSVLSALETLWQLRYINWHLPLPLMYIIMPPYLTLHYIMSFETAVELSRK